MVFFVSHGLHGSHSFGTLACFSFCFDLEDGSHEAQLQSQASSEAGFKGDPARALNPWRQRKEEDVNGCLLQRKKVRSALCQKLGWYLLAETLLSY